MTFLIKSFAVISALILFVVAMFGQIITLGGLLLVAIKVAIIAIFVALLVMIVFSILRDRSRRRHEAQNL